MVLTCLNAPKPLFVKVSHREFQMCHLRFGSIIFIVYQQAVSVAINLHIEDSVVGPSLKV